MEFNFVSLGDDWPTTNDFSLEESSSADAGQHQNPLRRAAQWARNVRRRS